ncbi:MAG TPA: GAF domain-containing protein [Thermoanaerobaculia bacterium]|nr:GAF domain-containing protein [Thermoanaerobaculia bacterium]
MSQHHNNPGATREERYAAASEAISSIFRDEGGNGLDDIAMMATINSLLVSNLEAFYWTGFYRVCGDKLVVGPYIGTVGCLQIPFGKGVCGVAARDRKTVIVDDVEKFPGHIACDARSRSEIVVPVFDRDGQLIAVLDVDSERLGNFDEVDQRELEKICAVFAR